MKELNQQECKDTAKRISKTLEDILPEKIKFYNQFDLELNEENKQFTGLLGICQPKYKKEIRTYQEKFLEVGKDNINYLEEILKETKESANINSKKLENIKLNLEKKNEIYKQHTKGSVDSEIYQTLFQYRDFVENEAKHYFETSSYDITGIGGMLDDSLNCLIKYSSSSHVKPIIQKLVKKIGEIYNISADREIHGNKTIAYRSFMGGSLSTTNQCIDYIRRIGKSLELSEEDIFSIAKIKRSYKKLSEYHKLRE